MVGRYSGEKSTAPVGCNRERISREGVNLNNREDSLEGLGEQWFDFNIVSIILLGFVATSLFKCAKFKSEKPKMSDKMCTAEMDVSVGTKDNTRKNGIRRLWKKSSTRGDSLLGFALQSACRLTRRSR